MTRLLLTVLLVAFCCSMQAADDDLFKKVKVTITFINPPNNRPAGLPSTSITQYNKWAMIQADFYPKLDNLKDAWIDSPVMAVTVALKSDNPNSGILLTGKTNFQTIRMDGKKHIAVMFVPGKILDRYLPASVSTINSSYIEAKVEFTDRANKVIGSGFSGSEKKYDELSGQNPKMIENVVLPLNKSPWGYGGTDDFDLIKEY